MRKLLHIPELLYHPPSRSRDYLQLFLFISYPLDDLVSEKERYKDIGDDLDIAFVELILKE